MTMLTQRVSVVGVLAVALVAVASRGGYWSVDAQESATALPPGVILPFAGSVAPSGFLLANGRVLDAKEYPALCGAIRDKFAIPNDPLGTCRLPDLQGRVPMGVAGTRWELGKTGGREAVNLTTEQLPEHGHTLNGLKGQIAMQRKDGDPIGRAEVNAAMRPDGWGVPFTELTKTLSTDTAGKGAPIETLPPFVVVSYIVKQ